MLTRIFAPFEQGTATAAQRFGGLGLGLAIARTIVELHQGSLFGLSDGVGQGATFVLELPKLPHLRTPESSMPAETEPPRP
jgi:signal transduction histidine kinase